MAAQSFHLVMRAGPNPGKTYELAQSEITIGRDNANRVVVNDAEVSRKHARLVAQGGGYVIEDLGSTNGTFVEGQRLMGPHLLRPGETIMLGEKISLSFETIETNADATLPQASPPTPMETYRVTPTPEPGYPPAPQAYEPSPPPPYQPPPAYQPPPPPVYQPTPKAYEPPPPPVYSHQAQPEQVEIYEQPAESYPISEEQPRKRTWLIVGCGCLIVILCCLVVAVVAYQFDTLDLYCEPPFDTMFSWLWNCP
jgi:predicted component of type VI protein secretion system